jgi:hypothetical protein
MFRNRKNETCPVYPLQLPVRYETQERDRIVGQGQTLAMSSDVVLFECDRNLRRDQKIRLILAWPAALPDGTELNLWILGTVTRSARDRVDVRVISYEFKTRRARSAQPVVAPARSRLLLGGLEPAANITVH